MTIHCAACDGHVSLGAAEAAALEGQALCHTCAHLGDMELRTPSSNEWADPVLDTVGRHGGPIGRAVRLTKTPRP